MINQSNVLDLLPKFMSNYYHEMRCPSRFPCAVIILGGRARFTLSCFSSVFQICAALKRAVVINAQIHNHFRNPHVLGDFHCSSGTPQNHGRICSHAFCSYPMTSGSGAERKLVHGVRAPYQTAYSDVKPC